MIILLNSFTHEGFSIDKSGLEINEKIQSQFCDRVPKFSRN